MGSNQSCRENPGQAEWGGTTPELSGINVPPLVKGRIKTTFTSPPGPVFSFSEAQQLPGHCSSILVATGSQGTGPRCFLVFVALGGKAKSIQAQTEHRGNFKGFAAKLQSTAPSEQQPRACR